VVKPFVTFIGIVVLGLAVAGCGGPRTSPTPGSICLAPVASRRAECVRPAVKTPLNANLVLVHLTAWQAAAVRATFPHLTVPCRRARLTASQRRLLQQAFGPRLRSLRYRCLLSFAAVLEGS